MASKIKFEWKGECQSVVLFPGIEASELQNVLKSAFSLNSDIIGFVGKVYFKF
jgi:hypothetical protein